MLAKKCDLASCVLSFIVQYEIVKWVINSPSISPMSLYIASALSK